MSNGKFQLFQDTKGEFRFRLRAGNHEIILAASEGYSSKQGCQNGIDSVKSNSPEDGRYKRAVAKNGMHYFTLTAANGQTLGISEMYKSKDSQENGISSVKKNAPEAVVQDLTVEDDTNGEDPGANSNGIIEIFQDVKGEYRFRLRSGNYEIILAASEGYKSKQGALNAVESVQTNASNDDRYKRLDAQAKEVYFTLVAANGETLGMSEMYQSPAGRDNGINAVKRDAPTATILDLTLV